VIAATGLGLVAAPLGLVSSALSAQASPDGTKVVISEVYGGGGNSGATLKSDFIELYNPTETAISLSGKSVQYRSSAGGAPTSGSRGVFELTGSIPAESHWLIKAADGTGGTTDLPTADATSDFTMSGSGGQVYLANQTGALTLAEGSVVDNQAVIDLVGYGTSTRTFETTPTASTSNTTSAARDSTGTDIDDNKADFTLGAPDPENSGGGGGPEEPPPADPVDRTIPEIQGSGDASPIVDTLVTTTGVVTAAYPTGGFDGFYLQTPGSGDADPATSDGVFIYTPSETDEVEIGDNVSVTGPVKEFFGLTQVAARTDGVDVQTEVGAVKAAAVAYPDNDADRESLEGMLLDPQGDYTVTDNYSLNQYAEIGLASGTTTLRQPTDIARPGSAGYQAALEDIDARAVTLDDGASADFLRNEANQDIALPYLTSDRQIRVGAPVTFTEDVILDYRFGAWKFQPTDQLMGDEPAPAMFEDTRTAAPEAVGGDVQVGTFNVLNYFSTTGVDANCTSFYYDRDDNPITVNRCGEAGPRGAADDENLGRQQVKIVKAINALGVDVVSLEEIENSAAFGQPRDAALAHLVAALNEDIGRQVWEFVPSPATVPENEDVIRTAYIHKKSTIETVGPSEILDDPAFVNARQPLAQVFKPADGAEHQSFAVIANHFKSKGSGEPGDGDQGDGQGASNKARVAQAHALAGFADDFKESAGTEKVFLVGDFNSYTEEDPMHVLYDAGYTNLVKEDGDKSTYLFGGLVGSLDHVLANEAANEDVTGVDVWNINSVEPIALEYSRFNYNATNFYDQSPFRSSDHDPVVVGFTDAKVTPDMELSVKDREIQARKTKPVIEVSVTAPDQTVTGWVAIRRDGDVVDVNELRRGETSFRLERYDAPGEQTVEVEYLGSSKVARLTESITFRVVA
jgi:5'-nucleotidase